MSPAAGARRLHQQAPWIRWTVADINHKVPLVALVSKSYPEPFDLFKAILQRQLLTFDPSLDVVGNPLHLLPLLSLLKSLQPPTAALQSSMATGWYNMATFSSGITVSVCQNQSFLMLKNVMQKTVTVSSWCSKYHKYELYRSDFTSAGLPGLHSLWTSPSLMTRFVCTLIIKDLNKQLIRIKICSI